MKREFICLICPNSFRITAECDEQKIRHIEGAQCQKGKEFIEKNEIKKPLTSLPVPCYVKEKTIS